MAYRRTLRHEVGCTGIGLHSGKPVRLTLRPAPAEHGIRFLRSDVGVEIPATLEYLARQDHATTLSRDGVSIGTVEHLLSALLGLGMDDVLVEVDGPEIPVLDGSAAPFVILLHEAGLKPLAVSRQYLKVLKTVEVVRGGKRARLSPADHFSVSYTCATRRSASGSLRARTVKGSRPPAPSASCAMWRPCGGAASPSGGAWKTRW